MNNIFLCTNDSIEMDLLVSGLEEVEAAAKFDIITEELTEDSSVIKIDGNYILGGVTATYLKMQYGIECSAKQIA